MPYVITQRYLPPDRGDIPALTPAEAGTRLSDPGGMQGWVELGCVYIAYNAVPRKEDRATAVGSMHRNLVEIRRAVSEICSRCRRGLTDTHKHACIQIAIPRQATVTNHVSQSCPRVHFVWLDPTQPINWLTQPNPTHKWENLDTTQPNTTHNGVYSLGMTYFYTENLSRTSRQPGINLFTFFTDCALNALTQSF